MRTQLIALSTLALALGACVAPAPRPIVVTNTAPPPTQTTTTTTYTTPAVAAPTPEYTTVLVSQCQSLFSQSLGGAPMNYASPIVTNTGDVTSIRLSGQISPITGQAGRQYNCTFSHGALTTAGAV